MQDSPAFSPPISAAPEIDYESVGRVFESPRARHSAAVRGTVLAPWLPATSAGLRRASISICLNIGEGAGESLMRYRKTGEGVEEEALLPVRFVPLLEGVARD